MLLLGLWCGVQEDAVYTGDMMASHNQVQSSMPSNLGNIPGRILITDSASTNSLTGMTDRSSHGSFGYMTTGGRNRHFPSLPCRNVVPPIMTRV
jgi:hypothetical protein